MLLTELKERQKAVISKIRGRSPFRKRVFEMGFVPGKEVTSIRKTPFKGPSEYSVMGSYVVLRYNEAELIECDTADPTEGAEGSYGTIEAGNPLKKPDTGRSKIKIALVGNPISGKTSLFNLLTGSHERVGNYSGVTVEPQEKVLEYNGYRLQMVDLPGTYSLGSGSQVNRVIRDFIHKELPDVVVNVVDATNLERNLLLTTDLIDLDVQLLMALNMHDSLLKSGDRFDHHAFGQITGVPVIPVDAVHGKGKTDLLEAVIALYSGNHPDSRHVHINYGEEVELSIRRVQTAIRIPENAFLTDRFSTRFLSIQLLNKDEIARSRVNGAMNHDEILKRAEEESARLQKTYGQSIEEVISDAKFSFISGALRETYKAVVRERRKISDRIDAIVMNKVLAFPIFIGLMWLMFASAFKLGEYPMHWIEAGVMHVSSWVERLLSAGILRDLLVDGIISGVGGVLIFLPNILILYFFIALMEDTGYMSRAVFLMDRIMHKMGLHGKSFIPLVMGFGCNVPAILSTRMLENRNERLITILINPFISCNARLPVYVLFISAFFPESSGTVLFGIYALGVVVAVLTAFLLRKTFFKKAPQPFVMELPPYRVPGGKTLMMHMWRRSAQYLKKIGGVILIASVIFWTLSYFPRNSEPVKETQKAYRQVSKDFDQRIAQAGLTDSAQVLKIQQERTDTLNQMLLREKREQKEYSYLGRIGRFIEPVIRPLGFDWRIGISIISGIPAKEIIVSSLSILYQADDHSGPAHHTLVGKLRAAGMRDEEGRTTGGITPLIALSFMIFVLLYLPCIGTLTAIIRESGSWKWGAFMIVYSFAIAWILSFIVYQTGTLMGY